MEPLPPGPKISVKLSAACRTEPPRCPGSTIIPRWRMPGASDSDQWLRYGSAARVVPLLPVNSQQPYNASVSDCQVRFRAATLTCVTFAVSVTFSTVRVRRPRLRGPFWGLPSPPRFGVGSGVPAGDHERGGPGRGGRVGNADDQRYTG